jgi:hypothetical protein
MGYRTNPQGDTPREPGPAEAHREWPRRRIGPGATAESDLSEGVAAVRRPGGRTLRDGHRQR